MPLVSRIVAGTGTQRHLMDGMSERVCKLTGETDVPESNSKHGRIL